MKTDVDNPQILLLKESISTVKNDSGALSEIESIVSQEEHWIGIIKNKLTQVKPSIIIVEKDINYKILDALR
jgi:hypothetical protein